MKHNKLIHELSCLREQVEELIGTLESERDKKRLRKRLPKLGIPVLEKGLSLIVTPEARQHWEVSNKGLRSFQVGSIATLEHIYWSGDEVVCSLTYGDGAGVGRLPYGLCQRMYCAWVEAYVDKIATRQTTS